MSFKENDVVVCVNNTGLEDVLEVGQEYEVAISRRLIFGVKAHQHDVTKANDVVVIEYPFAASRFVHKES